MRINMSIKKDRIIEMLPHLKDIYISKELIVKGELAMFKSGAKLYKSKRNGDWIISGYSKDGRDVVKAVSEIIGCKL